MNPAFAFFELLMIVTEKDTFRLSQLSSFFDTQPPFGPRNENLMDMLRSPAIAVPHSLGGQLEYIMEHWGHLLGKYFHRILRSLDVFKEEEKISFLGPGPTEVHRYRGTALEFEAEHFTPDKAWMPRLVLMAKNIYVWLDQISKQYKRPITKLHEIPDEEFDKKRLQRSWLMVLGTKPRVPEIKQMCGT
jgi:hypothetical protein